MSDTCEIVINDPAIPEELDLHPTVDWLRQERMPHIWCPGCGIGTSVNCFTRAVEDSGLSRENLAIVSGIGCTGRVAGYLRLDSFHTTHGRAIPFATGLKLASPKTKVVVYSGDGDLFAIGGNHFIHAARRNVDLTVLCVNNFNYAGAGGRFNGPIRFDGTSVQPAVPGAVVRRGVCRTLDGVPRQAVAKGDQRGAAEAGVHVH